MSAKYYQVVNWSQQKNAKIANVLYEIYFISLVRGHSITTYMDKMRWGGGQKISVFVHAQGVKTVHAGEGGSKNGKILST